MIKPEKSRITSDKQPYLPGTKVWINSVNAATPKPCAIFKGTLQNQCLFWKNNKNVRVENIPNTKKAPK